MSIIALSPSFSELCNFTAVDPATDLRDTSVFLAAWRGYSSNFVVPELVDKTVLCVCNSVAFMEPDTDSTVLLYDLSGILEADGWLCGFALMLPDTVRRFRIASRLEVEALVGEKVMRMVPEIAAAERTSWRGQCPMMLPETDFRC